MPKKKEKWCHKLKVRFFSDKDVVYIERIKGLIPVRSEYPHESVTLDYDSYGRLVGVEVVAAPKTKGIYD